MEKGAERSTPPTPEHTKQGKTFSIGQARKRAIAVFIVLTNLVPMISFGLGIGGGLIIGQSLGVDGPSQAAWIPASYSYVSFQAYSSGM